MLELLPQLVGGLSLFLLAIARLSRTLENAFTDKARAAIERYGKRLLVAVLVGTLLTVVLDSSSAVIILTIVFVNARTLTLRQAIGIVLGANIGTTFSSQLIALDVGAYAVIPLAVGLVVSLAFNNERVRQWGEVALYFGMLFFGLYLVEGSVVPLQDEPAFETWIARADESPWQGAMIGGVATLLIQSSSATVGLAIVLARQDLLTFAGGAAIMLGAELGTCSDTLIATIGGSRRALKTGLFHVGFNVVTIALGLLLFAPFVAAVESISGDAEIDTKIAHAHVLFNVAGVLLALPFVGLATGLLERVLPDRDAR